MSAPKYRGFAPPTPKGKLCEKMCETCPFKPDGSGYAVDHPEFPNIKTSIELGFPFYCHETVLFDPRTAKDADGNPTQQYEPHFEECRGAWEHRMKVWRERVDVVAERYEEGSE